MPAILLMPMLACVLSLGIPADGSRTEGLRAKDIFGRSLDGHGLVLVDWEGYMANPAIKLFLVPPPDARYPARIVVSAREPRLYFDMPSEAGPSGPRKVITLQGPEEASLYVSIFPDRDAHDEDYALDVEFTDADGVRRSLALPVHVVDQDRDRRSEFRVTVDFSEDKTGFFGDEGKRAVVTQAAEDWAYFLDGNGLDPTPAGAETTLIWDPDGFNTSHRTDNGRAYNGYLLYVYGIDSPLLRSGGEPSSFGGFQSTGGKALAVRRSGGYEAEVKGNYNRKGWLVGLSDAEWWRATNLGDVENDLYSIAHHEIGHALVFNPANLRFGEAKRLGKLPDDRVKAYLGGDPKIDQADHLAGSIDPASQRGAFGNEYHGKTPYGRWLITRTDLLCAQAVGYKLRGTSAFSPLTLRTEALPEGTASAPYTATLRADGGTPSYDWTVVEGLLPEGVTLDPFTGELRGMPKRPGTFEFDVKVRDHDQQEAGRSRRLRLVIGE
jgi:hypothetical protein